MNCKILSKKSINRYTNFYNDEFLRELNYIIQEINKHNAYRTLMNYRHGYHAGSFADVFKHIILMRLIKNLLRKEEPFCYLDTHAGAGRYDFSTEFMKKTESSATGIIKLMNALEANSPPIIKEYLEMIREAQYPNYYPGSPLIAKTLLRPTDRLILIELHGQEYKILKENLKGDRRIAIHHQDGYQALKAFLPPKERRGIILIDPAFEQQDEWERLLQILSEGIKKFSTGLYAVWYPIKDLKVTQKFVNSVTALDLPNLLKIEFSIYPLSAPLSLNGCGMLIVNSPWQFSKELEDWLPWLWEKLSIGKSGNYSIEEIIKA